MTVGRTVFDVFDEIRSASGTWQQHMDHPTQCIMATRTPWERFITPPGSGRPLDEWMDEVREQMRRVRKQRLEMAEQRLRNARAELRDAERFLEECRRDVHD